MKEAPKPDTATPPAYVPYATLLSSLESLKKNGIPSTGKIDKTLFDSYAGSVQTQLLSAYRFFGFTDASNLVQPLLPQVVNADGDTRKRLIKGLVEQKYARLLALDLQTISPGQLDEAFREFNISGSTLIRAERFFVKACVELSIPISKRISDKGATKAASASNGGARPTKVRSKSSTVKRDSSGELKPPARSSWEDKLLQKFPAFDPKWPDDLKTKWFEGFERFMTAKKES